MKNRIKLTETQLRKAITKIIKEELMNELEDSTIQNALLKTKQDSNRQGQHKRMSRAYADRFFNKFVGRELFGYPITKIELSIDNGGDNTKGDFDRSFNIFLRTGNGGTSTIEYHYPSDSLTIGGEDSRYAITPRRDAILLCRMVGAYNTSTKYKINNINNLFTIRNNAE